jgi:hypothetical protein
MIGIWTSNVQRIIIAWRDAKRKKKKKKECKCKQKLWQPTINIVRKRYKLDVYDMEAGEKQLFVRERDI